MSALAWVVFVPCAICAAFLYVTIGMVACKWIDEELDWGEFDWFLPWIFWPTIALFAVPYALTHDIDRTKGERDPGDYER